MYIIISILILVLCSWALCSKRILNVSKKRQELFDFALTIIATFFGVLLAIILSNENEFNKEKNNVIKILNAAAYDITVCANRTKGVYNISKINKDNIHHVRQTISDNPIRMPNLFSSIMNNDLVLRHISERGIREFSNHIENTRSMKMAINNERTINDTLLLSSINTYIKQLNISQKILALEIEILLKKISSKNIDSHYDYLNHELIFH